jgi:hypothetical protein
MADVNTQTLYDLKIDRFGVGTSGTVPSRFRTVFFSACSYVCNTIRARCAGVSVTTPTDLATDFTGLDEDVFFACVSSGVDFFISNHGEWQDNPKGDLRAIWQSDLRDAVMLYQRDTTVLKGRLGSL